MKKVSLVLLVFVFVVAVVLPVSAQSSSAASILRAGLLGAGSGAIGGAASGADSEDLWIAALTGAGVNIVGGSLLDVITNDNGNVTRQTIQTRPVRVTQQKRKHNRNLINKKHITDKVYTEGFDAGYKAGFTSGFEEGYLAAYQVAYKQGYLDALRNRR